MKTKYNIYVGEIYFFTRESTSVEEAINETKIQIENLHPLNYSQDNLESYKDRFRNKKIEAFVYGSKNNPYIKK